jgi:hypothetical protein
MFDEPQLYYRTEGLDVYYLRARLREEERAAREERKLRKKRMAQCMWPAVTVADPRLCPGRP